MLRDPRISAWRSFVDGEIDSGARGTAYRNGVVFLGPGGQSAIVYGEYAGAYGRERGLPYMDEPMPRDKGTTNPVGLL